MRENISERDRRGIGASGKTVSGTVTVLGTWNTGIGYCSYSIGANVGTGDYFLTVFLSFGSSSSITVTNFGTSGFFYFDSCFYNSGLLSGFLIGYLRSGIG